MPSKNSGCRPAPGLNPVEGARANLKNGLGNLAATDVDQIGLILEPQLP